MKLSKKETLKCVLIGILSLVSAILLLLLATHMLFEFLFSPNEELIKSAKSSDGKYRIDAYLINGGATTDWSVRCYLSTDENDLGKVIYNQSHIKSANLKWISNDVVNINGQCIDLPDGSFLGYDQDRILDSNTSVIDNEYPTLTNENISYVYNGTKKKDISYKEDKCMSQYYVETTFKTFDSEEGILQRQKASKDKYIEILNEFSYDNIDDDVVLPIDEAKDLAKKILPSDIKEETVLVNEGYGKEAVVYSSKQGTFVVSFDKFQWFENDEQFFADDDVVQVRYLKKVT